MMKKLVVFGAAFHDVVKLVEAINRVTPTWDLLGFLDDTPERQDQHYRGCPVLGGREILKKFGQEPETYVFNNVQGHWKRAQRVAGMLDEAGCNVASLVHPSVDLNHVTLGRGCFLPEGVIVGGNSQIGDFVTVGLGVIISHDVTIGDFCFLGPGCLISGEATLEKGCFLGVRATLIRQRKLGAHCFVGAGSVVTKNFPEGARVVGVPARKLSGSHDSRIVIEDDIS